MNIKKYVGKNLIKNLKRRKDRRKVIKSIFGGSSLAFFSSSTMNILTAKENKLMNSNEKRKYNILQII